FDLGGEFLDGPGEIGPRAPADSGKLEQPLGHRSQHRVCWRRSDRKYLQSPLTRCTRRVKCGRPRRRVPENASALNTDVHQIFDPVLTWVAADLLIAGSLYVGGRGRGHVAVRVRRPGRMITQHMGKSGNWGMGELGNWGIGELGNWGIGELGNWGIGE